MEEPGKINITEETVRSSKQISCECGGIVFEEKMMFKQISSIMSPTGKEELFPINLVICSSCGLVPGAFDTHKLIPEEIRANKVNIIKN